MAKLSNYRVLSDGWVLGLYREAGEILPMSAAQVKYEPNVVAVADEEKPSKPSSRGKFSKDKADA